MPTAEKLQNFLKNHTGRPYSAPRGGPHRVLLPFLTGDLYLFYTTAAFPKASASEGVRFLRSPIRRLVQNNREQPRCASAIAKKIPEFSAETKKPMQSIINKALIDF